MSKGLLKIVSPCIALSALGILVTWATPAFATLSAEAEIKYVNYDAKDNSGQHMSANSLSQHYSILYQTQGAIVDGRLGKYNLSLGYDWSTFDTTVKTNSGTDSPSASRGHLLYQGEIVIDPKEVPLRLTAYSRDLNRNTFTYDDVRLIHTTPNNTLIGYPNLATGILNGVHIDSGATLVMGVKNGMTNGYNEMVRLFPMVMLDYRDTINRDRSSSTPIDNRFSRLAFVSLNKKDNWFHYRIFKYEDYIHPEQNYDETQIQLGTVDQVMQRRWIDFSNWLSVSADGQLIKRTSPLKTTNDSFSEFDLNLFGIAQRSNWELRSFNNFNRHKDDNGKITYRTTVPTYASGSLSTDTSWTARFAYSDNRDNFNNQFTDYTGGFRLDTLKRSPFTFSQEVNFEKAVTTSSELLVLSGTVETASTSRFSRDLGLSASYNIRNSTTEASGTSNFLEQIFKGNLNYSPTNVLRLALGQTLRLTNGSSQAFITTIDGSNINTPQYYNPRDNTLSISGSTFQSITEGSVSWNPLARLNLTLSIAEDVYLPNNGNRSYITRVTSSADYTGPNFKLTSRNEYAYEDTEPAINSHTVNSYNRANYTFNRNLDAYAGMIWSKIYGKTNSYDYLNWEQGVNYSFYKSGGIQRKLFELYERADYTETASQTSSTTSVFSNRTNTTNLSLGARYFPLSQLVLAAGSKYSFIKNMSNYWISYYGSLALNFRLLQASIDYAYGTVRADGRVEKRLTANVRKTF